MNAVVKAPEYPFHPWLVSLAGQQITVDRKADGYFHQVTTEGTPGYILSEAELTFPDSNKVSQND